SVGEVGPEAGSRLVGVLDAEIIAVLHGESFEHEPWSTRAVAEIMAMPGAFGYLAERERERERARQPAARLLCPQWRRRRGGDGAVPPAHVNEVPADLYSAEEPAICGG
ncbi:MAG: hypothetical protein V3T57_05095, partial [Kiloniellales bacterium]